jgi:hypothetical protein
VGEGARERVIAWAEMVGPRLSVRDEAAGVVDLVVASGGAVRAVIAQSVPLRLMNRSVRVSGPFRR